MDTTVLQPSGYFVMYGPEGVTFECGIIRTGNNMVSPYLFSKKCAHVYLFRTFKEGLIDVAERDIIGQQIDDSTLPRTVSLEILLLASVLDRVMYIEESLYDDLDGIDGEQIPSQNTLTDVHDISGKPTLH